MMFKRKVSNDKELHEAIAQLEQQVKSEEAELKSSYTEAKAALEPKNMLRNTFSYVAEMPEVQKALINLVTGFVVGYASKKAAKLMTKETLDKAVEGLNVSVQNVVINQLNRLEKDKPDNLLVQGLGLVRKFMPQSSPVYPFVRYK